MINYHFGHKDSSTLFFPLNQAVNINHGSSTRSWTGTAANARVEFSKREKRTRYLVGHPVEDIMTDEEVLIDYGTYTYINTILPYRNEHEKAASQAFPLPGYVSKSLKG